MDEREDGQTYFTMKRVPGESLESILDRLRLGEPVDGINARRLLSAFSQICLAIDFAHERGVLHRDLEPSNIMLGDYGEVYVLDWGLAKIDEAPELELGSASDPSGSGTGVGDVIGTLGYLPAEQLAGRAEPRSDVYALGAILPTSLDGGGAPGRGCRSPRDLLPAHRSRSRCVDRCRAPHPTAGLALPTDGLRRRRPHPRDRQRTLLA